MVHIVLPLGLVGGWATPLDLLCWQTNWCGFWGPNHGIVSGMVYFSDTNQSGYECQQRCFSAWTCFFGPCVIALCLVAFASNCKAQAQTRSDPSDLQAEASVVDLNLRIVWGGPAPTTYVGTLELDSGTLVCTQQLGIDSNDPSFLLKDATGKFAFRDKKTRFGGCDVHVHAK